MNSRFPVLAFGAAGIFFAGLATGYMIRGVRDDSPSRLDSALSSASAVALAATEVKLAQIPGDLANTYDEAYAATVEKPQGKELVARYAACLLNSNEDERRRDWLTLLEGLTPEEALEVRNVFLTMDRLGKQLPFEWNHFWPRWGKVDGAGAIAYISSQDQKMPWVRGLYDLVFRGWAAKDPEKALQWLQENEEAPHFDVAFHGAIKGLASTDLERATRFALESVPAGHGQLSSTMKQLAERAVETGQTAGLLKWFHGLPVEAGGGGHKQFAAVQVADLLKHAGADFAREFGTEAASAPWRVDSVIGGCAERIAVEDPAEAMRWLTSIPASPNDGSYPGMTRVVQQWARKELATLANWLSEPKPDAMQDQAMAAFSRFLLNVDPQKGAIWAGRIKDPRWKPREYATAEAQVRETGGN